MWLRIVDQLRCPDCGGALHLESFRETVAAVAAEHVSRAGELGVHDANFARYIEAGLLCCRNCQCAYPVYDGVPVLLTYTTPVHDAFTSDYQADLASLARRWKFPDREPEPGETFVRQSFSREWLEYSYDGVLWTSTYEEHERIFRAEVKLDPASRQGASYLEVGCGLGIVTSIAQRLYRGDAFGADLSLAAFRAAKRFRDNPFMHFVQASAFHLPFPCEAFDIVFSRGVLHHTWSTREALLAVARHCRLGGRLAVWLYGPGSIEDGLARRMAWKAEQAVRPILSRHSTSPFARAALSAIAFAYMGANAVLRLRNPSLQRYTFERALHAARDRFTPEFAHRQSVEETREWFREAGFGESSGLDWREVPASQQENYRRNTGVYGTRTEAGQARRAAAS